MPSKDQKKELLPSFDEESFDVVADTKENFESQELGEDRSEHQLVQPAEETVYNSQEEQQVSHIRDPKDVIFADPDVSFADVPLSPIQITKKANPTRLAFRDDESQSEGDKSIKPGTDGAKKPSVVEFSEDGSSIKSESFVVTTSKPATIKQALFASMQEDTLNQSEQRTFQDETDSSRQAVNFKSLIHSSTTDEGSSFRVADQRKEGPEALFQTFDEDAQIEQIIAAVKIAIENNFNNSNIPKTMSFFKGLSSNFSGIDTSNLSDIFDELESLINSLYQPPIAANVLEQKKTIIKQLTVIASICELKGDDVEHKIYKQYRSLLKDFKDIFSVMKITDEYIKVFDNVHNIILIENKTSITIQSIDEAELKQSLSTYAMKLFQNAYENPEDDKPEKFLLRLKSALEYMPKIFKILEELDTKNLVSSVKLKQTLKHKAEQYYKTFFEIENQTSPEELFKEMQNFIDASKGNIQALDELCRQIDDLSNELNNDEQKVLLSEKVYEYKNQKSEDFNKQLLFLVSDNFDENVEEKIAELIYKSKAELVAYLERIKTLVDGQKSIKSLIDAFAEGSAELCNDIKDESLVSSINTSIQDHTNALYAETIGFYNEYFKYSSREVNDDTNLDFYESINLKITVRKEKLALIKAEYLATYDMIMDKTGETANRNTGSLESRKRTCLNEYFKQLREVLLEKLRDHFAKLLQNPDNSPIEANKILELVTQNIIKIMMEVGKLNKQTQSVLILRAELAKIPMSLGLGDIPKTTPIEPTQQIEFCIQQLKEIAKSNFPEKTYSHINQFIVNLTVDFSNFNDFNFDNLFEGLNKLINILYLSRHSKQQNLPEKKLGIIYILNLIAFIATSKDIAIENEFYLQYQALVENIKSIENVDDIDDKKIQLFDSIFQIVKIKRDITEQLLNVGDFGTKVLVKLETLYEEAFEDPISNTSRLEKFNLKLNQTLELYKRVKNDINRFNGYIDNNAFDETKQELYSIKDILLATLNSYYDKNLCSEKDIEISFSSFEQNCAGTITLFQDGINEHRQHIEKIKGMFSDVDIADEQKEIAMSSFCKDSNEIVNGFLKIPLLLIQIQNGKNVYQEPWTSILKNKFQQSLDRLTSILESQKSIDEQLVAISNLSIILSGQVNDEDNKHAILKATENLVTQIREKSQKFHNQYFQDPTKLLDTSEIESKICILTTNLESLKTTYSEISANIISKTNAERIFASDLILTRDDNVRMHLQSYFSDLQTKLFDELNKYFLPFFKNPESIEGLELNSLQTSITTKINKALELVQQIKLQYHETQRLIADFERQVLSLKSENYYDINQDLELKVSEIIMKLKAEILELYASSYQNPKDISALKALHEQTKAQLKKEVEELKSHVISKAQQRRTIFTECYQKIANFKAKLPAEFHEVIQLDFDNFIKKLQSDLTDSLKANVKTYFSKLKQIYADYSKAIEIHRGMDEKIQRLLDAYRDVTIRQTVGKLCEAKKAEIKGLINDRYIDAFIRPDYFDNSIIDDHSDDEISKTQDDDQESYAFIIAQAIEQGLAEIQQKNQDVIESDGTDFEEQSNEGSSTEEMEENQLKDEVLVATKIIIPEIPQTIEIPAAQANNSSKDHDPRKQFSATANMLKKLKAKELITNVQGTVDELETERLREDQEPKAVIDGKINLLEDVISKLIKDMDINFGVGDVTHFLAVAKTNAQQFVSGELNLDFDDGNLSRAIAQIERYKENIQGNNFFILEKKSCIIRFWQLLKFLNKNQGSDNKYYKVHQALLTENINLTKQNEIAVLLPAITPNSFTIFDNICKIQQNQQITETNIGSLSILADNEYKDDQKKQAELIALQSDYKQASDEYYNSRYQRPHLLETDERHKLNNSIVGKLNDHLVKQNNNPHKNSTAITKHTGVKPYLIGAAIVMSFMVVIPGVIYTICRWLHLKEFNKNLVDHSKDRKLFSAEFFADGKTKREGEVEEITKKITAAPAA